MVIICAFLLILFMLLRFLTSAFKSFVAREEDQLIFEYNYLIQKRIKDIEEKINEKFDIFKKAEKHFSQN